MIDPAIEEQYFLEVADEWNLESLYRKLAEVKQINIAKKAKLSPVEKAMLRGLLAGYSPKKIANELHWTPASVGVELSKGIYRYVEVLTDREANTLSSWRDIAKWLEEAGYKRRVKTQQALFSGEELPEVAQFYGREQELDLLQKWVVSDRYRLVLLSGMVGMGKTTLAAYLTQTIKSDFEYIIWRDLKYQPSLSSILGEILDSLAPHKNHSDLQIDINSQITQLIEYLREYRCLLILDSLEQTMSTNSFAGFYSQEHQAYSQLIKRIAAENHQSCLLIASREEPIDMPLVQSNKADLFNLKGLGKAGHHIFNDYNLSSLPGHHQFEQRGEVMFQMCELMIEEFGQDCIRGRTDSLSLSVFTNASTSPDEHNHVIAQLRRLARQAASALTGDWEVELGAALYPTHGVTCGDLIAKASIAQDEGTSDLFTEALQAKTERRNALLVALPEALERGDIAPHFQPIIRATDNTLIGFEALVRWEHEELGRVIPPHIIEMATELHLLHELTGHILNCAIKEAMNWPDTVHFAINVTPSQLNNALIDLVRKSVRTSKIDPARLEIEVTEEALIDNFDASAEVIARLRAIGVCVAMDDFGAGYTSMGNLRKLAFSKIKIDKSISDGLPDDPKTIAIVRSLIAMAQELEVAVTVEGIEHENQLELLRKYDCGIQGYVFSPPLPPNSLTKLRPFLKGSRHAEKTEKKATNNVVPYKANKKRKAAR